MNKKYNSYEKMFKTKVEYLSEINNFVIQHFFHTLYILAAKKIFVIYKNVFNE